MSDLRAALGWNIFGDRADTGELEWSSDNMQASGHGEVFDNDTAVASVTVRGAFDTSLVLTDILRVWHSSDTGVARIDFDLGSEGTRNLVSADFDCNIEGTPLAEHIGYATCADAAADTTHPPPTGIINPTHDHAMGFHYTSRGENA
jgi:hypothetical protein